MQLSLIYKATCLLWLIQITNGLIYKKEQENMFIELKYKTFKFKVKSILKKYFYIQLQESSPRLIQRIYSWNQEY